MISRTRYWILFALLSMVYVAGLCVALLENDSAQFAVMAKRMVVENDFINLIKGTEDYLDKPHLHYWLAALSMKIFGFEAWAYRIPALLVTVLGAYSCFGLGKLLYSRDAGYLAALIFLSAQTIILSNMDVRTDAVLTGLTIFSLWQLAAFINAGKAVNIVLGALGAGLAFSTKGQIAILVIAIPLLIHLGYTGKWRILYNWKVVLGILVFAIVISPMLYAYYQQFDLHPEKVIRGRSGRSGIFFILWEQSFERLSGEGMGKNSSDYFFFFHTFLWVFLPWTVLGLLAFGSKIKKAAITRLRKGELTEILTVGGIALIFLVISFAQFKLPHYLNILIPLFAVLTAGYVHAINSDANDRRKKVLLGIQIGIACLMILCSLLIVFYVFPESGMFSKILFIAGTLILGGYFFRKEDWLPKIITVTVLGAVLLNLVMNLVFYPNLLGYQGGTVMAKIVKEHHIPEDKINKLGTRHTWAMDFANELPVTITSLEELKSKVNPWLYVTEEELQLLADTGIAWDMQFSVDHFRITRLQPRFLDPETRPELLEKYHLVRLSD